MMSATESHITSSKENLRNAGNFRYEAIMNDDPMNESVEQNLEITARMSSFALENAASSIVVVVGLCARDVATCRILPAAMMTRLRFLRRNKK